MFHVVLVAPEIPPNTGNAIRLCANSGAHLHLVEPLGFTLEDRQLKRAGLDYHELACMQVHADFASAMRATGAAADRAFAFTTRANLRFDTVAYCAGDALVFGAETRGLPEDIRSLFAPSQQLRLPMRAGNRSINLSNAVAVAVFEAWRQLGFQGAS